MKPIDSLIIRLPVGSGWSLYEAAFGAAQRFREEHGITLCGSGGHEFRARWTGKGAVVVELAPSAMPPREPKPPKPRKARASVMSGADAMIGTAPDAEIARALGVSRQLVSAYRAARGVAQYTAPPPPPKQPKPAKVWKAPVLDNVREWAAGLGRPFTVHEVCDSGCFRSGSSHDAQHVAFFRWLARGYFVAVGPDPARHGKAGRAKLYALAPS